MGSAMTYHANHVFLSYNCMCTIQFAIAANALCVHVCTCVCSWTALLTRESAIPMQQRAEFKAWVSVQGSGFRISGLGFRV